MGLSDGNREVGVMKEEGGGRSGVPNRTAREAPLKGQHWSSRGKRRGKEPRRRQETAWPGAQSRARRGREECPGS